MEELHRKILRENRRFIVDNLSEVESIIDGLMIKGVITESMRQDIMEAEPTAIKRARRLLDIIPKRGPQAFDIFCNVLADRNHRHVAERLNPSLKSSHTTPLPPTDKSSSSKSSAGPATIPLPIPTAVNMPGGDFKRNKHEKSPIQASRTPPQPTSISSAGSSLPGKPEKTKSSEERYGRQCSREVEKTYSPSDEVAQADFPIDWPVGLDLSLSSRDFEVKPIDQHDIKVELMLDVYPVSEIKRGRAVVINNWTFEQEALAGRKTAEQDSFWLQKVLRGLGFRVIVKSNLTRDDLFLELKKEVENDHIDMFVLVIMSYGGAGTVLGTDSVEIPVRDIIDVFSNTNCPSLVGKPKLFFIQACGTKLKDLQVGPQEVDNTDPDAVEEISKCMRQLNLGGHTHDMVDTKRGPASDHMPLPLEDTSDMLVAMATSPDQNNDKYSSLFILGLSYILSNFAKTDHILELLNKVNRLKKMRDSRQFVKLCEIKHSLTKTLYFFPGYAPQTANFQEQNFQSFDRDSFHNTKGK